MDLPKFYNITAVVSGRIENSDAFAISNERIEKGIVTCSAEVYNLTDENKKCCVGDVTLAMR